MRLLLIDPYVASGSNLNTSLGWLSAAVHKARHEVFVLDLNGRQICNYQKLLPEFISKYNPDMIGITVMCTTYVTMQRIVERVLTSTDLLQNETLLEHLLECYILRQLVPLDLHLLDILYYTLAIIPVLQMVNILDQMLMIQLLEL